MKIKQRPYREKKEKGGSGRRGLSGVQKAEICRLKERGVSQVTLAITFVDGIVTFLEQQPDGDFIVDNSFVRGLSKLKKKLFPRICFEKTKRVGYVCRKH